MHRSRHHHHQDHRRHHHQTIIIVVVIVDHLSKSKGWQCLNAGLLDRLSSARCGQPSPSSSPRRSFPPWGRISRAMAWLLILDLCGAHSVGGWVGGVGWVDEASNYQGSKVKGREAKLSHTSTHQRISSHQMKLSGYSGALDQSEALNSKNPRQGREI